LRGYYWRILLRPIFDPEKDRGFLGLNGLLGEALFGGG